jgi:hypothetical protein
MSIQELEVLLETTRQKIADQGRIADARLIEKERMLEQAVIDAHLDAPVEQLEAALESTRQKISNQEEFIGLSGVIQSIDPTLYEQKRMLEQAVIDAHLNREQDR